MSFLRNAALYTDYYELTMAQGYFYQGKAKEVAVFDYFYRDNPFHGGYVLFAGLGDLLRTLVELRFEPEDIDFLRSKGFRPEFLDYLATFRFTGNVRAVNEGEIIFPLTPILQVEAPIVEAQVIETLLLNVLNFSSLIATKASRMRLAAGNRTLLDFGLRRSQGLGGIQATVASFIGGVEATSNVYAARDYNLKLSGTMAHSWVQSFESELDAYNAYADQYPDTTVLLVDTYDTLRSGVPNAIKTAKYLEKSGKKLLGIRIDSGDLAYLSRQARIMLDEAGLQYVKIAVSNQLDEYIIKSILDQGAPVDIFGVGTRLVTGHDDSALDGVYKLSKFGGKPKIKISENIVKVNFPDKKNVIRYSRENGEFTADAICLESEKTIETMFHPFFPEKNIDLRSYKDERLLQPAIHKGELARKIATIDESASYAKKRLAYLAAEYRRFEFPHEYKVGITRRLLNLQRKLLEQHKRK
jgi:nicotinate phosphoribosyltransferase